jgi:hypothetical protein
MRYFHATTSSAELLPTVGDCQGGWFANNVIPNQPVRYLLRVDPGVRARHLDRHIRKPNPNRLAIAVAATIG